MIKELGKFIYYLTYLLSFLILKLVFGLKIIGKGNIPSRGCAVLVANHSTLVDPFIITCATPRIIHWLVKGWVYKKIGLS
ncbi:MAG: hypothetical protein N2Z79_03405, partial [Candidatus Omnitrophica bacterium]|nr:hypothetical protein [Candidatus Omnitrophota bacterium]